MVLFTFSMAMLLALFHFNRVFLKFHWWHLMQIHLGLFAQRKLFGNFLISYTETPFLVVTSQIDMTYHIFVDLKY